MKAALMSVTFTSGLSRRRMMQIDDDGFISDLVNAHGFSASLPTSCAGNVIENLQLEVDHSQIVVVDRNPLKRAMRTAGIGIFTTGDKAIEDYQITNNMVIDSRWRGL